MMAYQDPTRRSELIKFLRSRRLWTGPLPWILGVLLVANIAMGGWSTAILSLGNPQLNVGKALQGEGAPYPGTPEHPAYRVRYDRSIGDHLDWFLPHIPDARQHPLVIATGMSQMYTMNDYKPGDETIAEYLDDSLSVHGIRAFGLAAPNLAHDEALFLLLTTLTDERTHPNTFILDVCFEKLREGDLRPSYRKFLRTHPKLLQMWRNTADSAAAAYPLAAADMKRAIEQLDDTEKKEGDETVESRLRSHIAEAVPIVKWRTDLNAQVKTIVFQARNWAFHITPMTKRPIIPTRYAMNQQYLGIIADVAARHGTHVIIFNAPLNPQSQNPYIPSEYAAFKTWLADFTTSRSIPYVDLEKAVPADAWGEFLGGPDFKHFRSEGHRLTALALLQHFESTLEKNAGL